MKLFPVVTSLCRRNQRLYIIYMDYEMSARSHDEESTFGRIFRVPADTGGQWIDPAYPFTDFLATNS